MGTALKRIGGALALLCLVLSVVADDPPFPRIQDLLVEFYEAEVQITDLNQQVFGIAKEYYDNTVPRGKLELRTMGKLVSVIYDKDINEVLEVQDSNCQTWGIDESTYVYEATFYGWLNKNPLIIGPSAALWTAKDKMKDIVYTGKKKVRNVLCDSYTLPIKGLKEDVNFTYYFAGTDWETPYQVEKLRVPIRIDANGMSSIGTGGSSDSIPINISTDFFYFRPYITDWLVFEPTLGVGCPLKKPTLTMPKMPSVFKYSVEVVDVLETEKKSKDTYRIGYNKVWYDALRRTARLDKHNSTSFFSELYDFSTGVTYKIENDGSCKIKPLQNSSFEVYDNLVGHFKEPSEVFNLDGNFYYMGKRLFRGIWCDSFESVQLDTTFMEQNVSKLVVTIFYTQDVYEVEVDGETEIKVPVYQMITGYKDKEKIINLQYNIFEFDDVIYPPMYASYRLEKCFPSSKEKSYFVMMINVEEKLSKQIELQEDVVVEQLRYQISKYAKISEMRIASLSVDYKPTLVSVTGLILDRPPALKQFYLKNEAALMVADKYLKPAVAADTEEKCAFSCVDNDDFPCLGFYFCKNACFLKSKGLLDQKEDDEDLLDLGEACKTWIRVTRDSMNTEAYLVDALKSLENAVMTKKISVDLINDSKITIVPIEQIDIGVRHFTGPPFPHISDLEVEFYETEVQITDLNQQVFGIAKEYYDSTAARGKLELKAMGNTQSVYYNNDTNEILEVNETNCQTWDIDESEYDYHAIFFGWLNANPLIIGPSAALWIANNTRNNIVYTGQKRVRNIPCDTYKLFIQGPRERVTLTYYFADSKWKTPFQMDKMRVPIRIEANGMSSRDTGDASLSVPINIITDFSYFRPTITDWLVFQPPIGLGCPLKKPTRTMPSMPKVFRYSAEVFDVMKTDPDNPEYTYDVENQQVWYDSTRMIARLDKYTRSSYFSELYDFNTGVTYRTENGRSCKIKPLRNSFFEAYDSQVIGHLKEPGEVLNLDGTFYYMGKRLIRAIWCDSFESVQMNVTFMKQDVSKLVVTIFYSQDFYQVAVDGETETRVPVYYIVTGYKDNKKIINLQYNIFEFDDVIWPDMYTSYRLGRCFPSLKDKSYFVLFMNVGEELARKMEAKDDIVKEFLRGQITKYANISDMRIPLLSIDYKSTGVSVTGLMLDRPPALKQFFMEFEGEVEVADKYLKPVISADTEEKCAFACVDNNDFTCMGFYFCKKACILKSKGIFDKKEDDEKTTDMGESCKTWIRVTRDSTNKEAYLPDALKSLETAVVDQKVKIELMLDDKTKKIIPIEQIAIGEGPYTGIGQDKPYAIVINFAKMDKEDTTTTEVKYVDNVNDCYKACKDSDTLACASFSFCPSAANKECMLSSTMFVDRKTDPDGTKEDVNCYIYSIKYVDLYEPYPGRVALISGDDAFSAVGTLEECARKCRESTKVKCRGFEYCRSTKSCVLHSRHILDLKAGEVTNVDKKSPCVHYAAKFTADYDDMGYTLLEDNSDVREKITLQECAKTCSEELKSSCNSFNYCPPSQPFETDSSCALSSRILRDSTPVNKDKCHHFEKKKVVDDWKKPVKTAVQQSGYTSKGFTGLVIGMMVLGLIVGALGFVSYSRYRSRAKREDTTVTYTKELT